MQNTGLRRRMAAILYDTILITACLILVIIVFIAMAGGEAIEADENSALHVTLAITIYVFLVGFWTRSGRTLGMQSWGLQLETRDGSPPSLSAATVRFFAALISWTPLGLGFFWQLWDKEHLTWHDRLSGTRLVYYPKIKK